MRLLAYAALKPLDDQLTEREITFVPMGRRRTAAATSTTTGPFVTPLAVTLSRPLMHSLISAQISLRRLHTRQLSVDLLRNARAPLPLPNSYININEMLPTDIHRLRVATRAAAKYLGFTTFVRDGRVYIKLGKEARAVQITSHEDL